MDDEFGYSGESSFYGSEYNSSIVNLDNNRKTSGQRRLTQEDIQSLNTNSETSSESVSHSSSSSESSVTPAESASQASSSSSSASASSSSATSSSASSGASGAGGSSAAASSAGASAGTVAGTASAGVGLVAVVVGVSTGLGASIALRNAVYHYDKYNKFDYQFAVDFEQENEIVARVNGTNVNIEQKYALKFDEAEIIPSEENTETKTYTANFSGEFEADFLKGIQYTFDIFTVNVGIETNYLHEQFMGEYDPEVEPEPEPPEPVVEKKYYVVIGETTTELTKVEVEGSSALATYSLTTSLTKNQTISFKEDETALAVSLEKDADGNTKSGNNVAVESTTENAFYVLTTASSAQITLSQYENYWSVWVTGYSKPIVTKTYSAVIDGEAHTMSEISYEGTDALHTYALSIALTEGSDLMFMEGTNALTVELERDPETGEPAENNNVTQDGDLFYVLTSTEAGQILLFQYSDYWAVWVDGYEEPVTTDTFYVSINGTKTELDRLTIQDDPSAEVYVTSALLYEGDGLTFYKNDEHLSVELEIDPETGDIKEGNNVARGETMDFEVINPVSMGQIKLTNNGTYWSVWVEGNESSDHAYYLQINGDDMYELEEVTLDPWPEDSLANFLLNIDLEEQSELAFFEDDSQLEVIKRQADGQDLSGNNVNIIDNVMQVILNASNADVILSQYSNYWAVWVDGYSVLVEKDYHIIKNYSSEPYLFERVTPTPTGLKAKYVASLDGDVTTISPSDSLQFCEGVPYDYTYINFIPKAPYNNLKKEYTGDSWEYFPRFEMSTATDVFLEIDETEQIYVHVDGYSSYQSDLYLAFTPQSTPQEQISFMQMAEESLDSGVNNMFTASYDSMLTANMPVYVGNSSGDFSEVYSWDEVHMNNFDSGSDSVNNLAGYMSPSDPYNNTGQIIMRSPNVQSMAGGTPQEVQFTLYEYVDHYYVSCDKFALPFDITEDEENPITISNDELVFNFISEDFNAESDTLKIKVSRDSSMNDPVTDYWRGSAGAIALLEQGFEEEVQPLYVLITLTHNSMDYVVAYFTMTY